MDKKRALIIATNGLGKSGVPNVIMEIVRAMSKDYIFDIIINRNDHYYKEEFESYGGKIFFFDFYNNKGNIFLKIFNKLCGKAERIKRFLLPILKKNNYEVIHSFAEINSYYYFKVAKKVGIRKRIMHVNRIYELPSDLIRRIHAEFLINQSCNHSTNRIAVSELCGSIAFKKYDFKVIYNSIDENIYNCNIEYNEKSPLSLLQIGTILPLKNQLFSLNVLNEIRKKVPNAVLYFIGKIYDKEYYRICQKYIHDYKLENNVFFLPFDYNQKEIIKKSTYALIPSTKEGLSLVTIEAQACGMYCFASDAITKETDCGSAIYLQLNPFIWAKAIITIFEKKQYRYLKNDINRFSREMFSREIKSLYKSK